MPKPVVVGVWTRSVVRVSPVVPVVVASSDRSRHKESSIPTISAVYILWSRALPRGTRHLAGSACRIEAEPPSKCGPRVVVVVASSRRNGLRFLKAPVVSEPGTEINAFTARKIETIRPWRARVTLEFSCDKALAASSRILTETVHEPR